MSLGGTDGGGSLPWTCGFENSCGMRQRTDDTFDWTRSSYATPTAGTGPNGAHEGTYYMFIEADGRFYNDRAL